MMITKSAEHLRGYFDFWSGKAPAKQTPDYISGYMSGSEAKRILEEFGFSTDTNSYQELSEAI